MSDDSTFQRSKNKKPGYGKPPSDHQYRKGQTGNPKGRPKKADTLSAMLDYEMHHTRSVPMGGKRRQISPKLLMVKSVVANAMQGDRQALREIVALTAEYGDSIPRGPAALTFREALGRTNWDKLTPDFFDKQDAEIAAWKKQVRETVPIALILKRELDHKVDGIRHGKPAKVRVRDVIVARFMHDAIEGDVLTQRLLRELVPEKKLPRFPRREIIARPTAAEQKTFETMQREEADRVAAAIRDDEMTPEELDRLLMRLGVRL